MRRCRAWLNLTLDSAFDRLRCHARAHNPRLGHLARDVVEGTPGSDDVGLRADAKLADLIHLFEAGTRVTRW